MSPSILGTNHASEDLLALRRVIAQFADRCHLDLADPSAVRCLLDGDCLPGQAPWRDVQAGQELRALLILLFRLETSSSEDLGIDGLCRLWHQHSEIMSRFQGRRPVRARRMNTFPAS